MAWIDRPIRVIVTFRDAKETDSSTYTRVLSSVSFTDAGAFAEAYATALESVSDAQVTGIQIEAQRIQGGFTQPPESSNALRIGALLFGTTDPDERYVLEIPSLRPELLYQTGPYAGVQIDLAQTAIQALATAIIDGDGIVSPMGVTGNDITSIVTGFLRLP